MALAIGSTHDLLQSPVERIQLFGRVRVVEKCWACGGSPVDQYGSRCRTCKGVGCVETFYNRHMFEGGLHSCNWCSLGPDSEVHELPQIITV